MKEDGGDQFKGGHSQPTESSHKVSKPADNQSHRFIPKGLHGQHPGIGVQLELDVGVERDAYGQPLSPTHRIATNKPFSGQRVGGTAADGNQAGATAAQQTHSNLASAGQ